MNGFPYNLNTLKIENCNISKQTTYGLVCALKQRNYVRVLSLVGLSFSAESIAILCSLLEKRNFIEELDLSNNRIEPKLFHPLLESLSKVRQMKSLSIAWNLLLQKAQPP